MVKWVTVVEEDMLRDWIYIFLNEKGLYENDEKGHKILCHVKSS